VSKKEKYTSHEDSTDTPFCDYSYRPALVRHFFLAEAVIGIDEARAVIFSDDTSPMYDGSDPWDLGTGTALSIGSFFGGPGSLVIGGGSEVMAGSVSTDGVISVFEANSTLRVENLLSVGTPLPNNTTLNISGGGSVYSGTGLLRFGGAATVTGTDSLWSNTNGLMVGWSSVDFGISAGTLDVLDSGVASVTGDFSIDDLGVVNLDGGSLSIDGNFDNTQGGTVNFKDGTIAMGGGTFQAVPFTASGGDADFTIDSETASGLSRLVLQNGATADWSHLPLGAALRVGKLHRGQLEITSGATLRNPLSLIATGSGSDGTALVTGDGSEWTTNAMRVG
jgi:hypothetical protein